MIIRNGLDSASVVSIEENNEKRFQFEKILGKIYRELNRKFLEEICEKETKLRKALLFEANIRLMKHPYDLIGRRRLKLFEESLKNYLRVGDHKPQKMTQAENLKKKIFDILNPNENVVDFLKVFKVVSIVALITLLVHLHDYIQDFKIVTTFWSIGYKGYSMKNPMKYVFLKVLLLEFYPPAMFLSIVMMFSLIQTILHIPSVRSRYRVSMHMENPSTEAGTETICPQDVYNQYNLSISESKTEAILQLMVQWGLYFGFSWFMTWRLKLLKTEEDPCELKNVYNLLNFWNLFPSLFSSMCSLTYGQYISHAITYKHRASRKQEIIYLASCGMNTMSNMFILLVWQTVGTDMLFNSRRSFTFDDPSSMLIIYMLLSTPILYKHMDLPPSTKAYLAPSMTTPKFLKSVRNQCLVYSFYLGLAGFFNTWLVTNFQPLLPKIAANITQNVTFLGKYSSDLSFHTNVYCLEIDPMDYTPSLAYRGDPLNNRLALIISSCVGIPLCFIFSYLGLFLYYEKDASCIAFQSITKVFLMMFI